METDGSLVSHGDLTHLAAAWNELVADGRGNAYVNQAGFDLMAGAEPTSGQSHWSHLTVPPDKSLKACGSPTAWPQRWTARR
jgi:hypothetical protein